MKRTTPAPYVSRSTIVATMVFAFLLLPAHTSFAGTPLGDLAASMQPGTWASLATNNINPTLVATGADGNSLGYTDDITYDPASQKFFYIGSDHNALSILATY